MPDQEITPKAVVEATRQLLGQDGEHWTKLHMEKQGSYCLWGALCKAAFGESNPFMANVQRGQSQTHTAYRQATRAVMDCIPSPSMFMFNDSPATTFDDIERVLECAKKLVDA